MSEIDHLFLQMAGRTLHARAGLDLRSITAPAKGPLQASGIFLRRIERLPPPAACDRRCSGPPYWSRSGFRREFQSVTSHCDRRLAATLPQVGAPTHGGGPQPPLGGPYVRVLHNVPVTPAAASLSINFTRLVAR